MRRTPPDIEASEHSRQSHQDKLEADYAASEPSRMVGEGGSDFDDPEYREFLAQERAARRDRRRGGFRDAAD